MWVKACQLTPLAPKPLPRKKFGFADHRYEKFGPMVYTFYDSNTVDIPDSASKSDV